MATLREKCAQHWSAVKAIGLSGQMHGAVLLDAKGETIRPAILWNDTRCAAECAELEAMAPELHQVAGNLAMPGFTAPKLLWVRRHEPQHFQRTATVLLPKDYLRYRMTGKSPICPDAAGTLAGRGEARLVRRSAGQVRPVAQPNADAGRRLRGFRHP